MRGMGKVVNLTICLVSESWICLHPASSSGGRVIHLSCGPISKLQRTETLSLAPFTVFYHRSICCSWMVSTFH